MPAIQRAAERKCLLVGRRPNVLLPTLGLCATVSPVIAKWLQERGIPARVVSGYFHGAQDWYHEWVETTIDGEKWIVDGTRNQFDGYEDDETPWWMPFRLGAGEYPLEPDE
jgi:hypothetical protein